MTYETDFISLKCQLFKLTSDCPTSVRKPVFGYRVRLVPIDESNTKLSRKRVNSLLPAASDSPESRRSAADRVRRNSVLPPVLYSDSRPVDSLLRFGPQQIYKVH